MDETKIGDDERPHPDSSNDDIELSDVIAVIRESDPDFETESSQLALAPMLNGVGRGQTAPSGSRQKRPRIIIIEQPATKALRYRYECEGRSAGSIPGENSTSENKTYPEIEIEGYRGDVVVVVSLVTKDEPYLAHPHNLVGKDCAQGVCTVRISPDTMRAQFQNLGIQCKKKRDIEASLKAREKIRVDPFHNHFEHRSQPNSIDLNAVRLCFQAYIKSPNDERGPFNYALKPVVSNVIYDKKSSTDLTIVKLCSCVSKVNGRNTMILLCEKVSKEDIEIHFFELDADNKQIWLAKADFGPAQVHKQCAIQFKTPPYKSLDITEPVNVFIKLYRPSDQQSSEPLTFQYLPLDSACASLPDSNKRKRAKYEGSYTKTYEGLTDLSSKIDKQQISEMLQAPLYDSIKPEPVEMASPHSTYGGASPYGGSVQVYQPNIPYQATPATSPYYAQTPSPDTMNNQYRHQPVNIEFNNFAQPLQNEACSIASSIWPDQLSNATPLLLNLDTNQYNSEDLTNQLQTFQGQGLSLTALSLDENDLNIPALSENSLTNIVNEAMDRHGT